MKNLLMTPGPSNVDPMFMGMLGANPLHHRDEAFKDDISALTQNLKTLLHTRGDIAVLGGTGSLAMEAAVCNFFSSGDSVLVLENGKFSSRFAHIAREYGLRVVSMQRRWGESENPLRLKKILQEHKNIKGVFAVHHESSTGALQDIKTLGKIVREFGAVFVVDVVGSFLIDRLKMDAWKIDVALFSSQKGLKMPTGVSFLAYNERALHVMVSSNLPKFYLDLQKYRQNPVPFSTATGIISTCRHKSDNILHVGLDVHLKRQKNVKKLFIKLCDILGLATFTKGKEDKKQKTSCAQVVVRVPKNMRASDITSELKKVGITLSKGQDRYKEKILRIGIIGLFDKDDIWYFWKHFLAVLLRRGYILEEQIEARTKQIIDEFNI